MADRKRVVAYVDGFNVYHSLEEQRAPDEPVPHHLKWLDLNALARAIAHPSRDSVDRVEYFSALATHRKPESVNRHRAYVAALKATGVKVVLSSFKDKPRRCNKCKATWISHEEKETDVSIAVALVAAAYANEYDKALLFTADTDLVPAIRAVTTAFPAKEVVVAIPKNRLKGRSSLQQHATGIVRLGRHHFENNPLPDELMDDHGNPVVRPPKYRNP